MDEVVAETVPNTQPLNPFYPNNLRVSTLWRLQIVSNRATARAVVKQSDRRVERRRRQVRGIGPSLAAMLAADGMHVVADLLSVAPERVHDAVSTASTGVAHAYRLDPPGGRFIGVLVPGLFESFFRTLCVPWPRAAPPVDPQPVRVDRVLALAGRQNVTFLEPPLR